LNDAILCGWSLGAFVALQLASLLHSRISALVLVGATPRFTRSDDWEYGLTEKAVSGLGISYKRSPRKAMDSFISQMFSKSEIEQIEKIDECQKMFHSIPLPALDVALQGLELLIKSDVRFSLSSVVVPTVVVSGDSDSICLPLASNYLANHLNAELAIFQDAGHAPFLTQSNKFNQYIENFIRRIPHSAD